MANDNHDNEQTDKDMLTRLVPSSVADPRNKAKQAYLCWQSTGDVQATMALLREAAEQTDELLQYKYFALRLGVAIQQGTRAVRVP